MQQKKKEQNRQTKRHLIIGVIVFAVLAVGIYYVASSLEGWLYPELPASDTQTRETIEVNGKQYAARKLKTVLLIGLDSYGAQKPSGSYVNDVQSDFLLLIALDKSSGERFALQINRDTMARIPMLGLNGRRTGWFTGQMALAHTYGDGMKDSCRNTVRAMEKLLLDGFDIDHYVSITMAAIPVVNDWVGGVTVTIKDDFSAVDKTLEMGKTITLDGEQALTYVHGRGQIADSSNLNRMDRQRDYMEAWLERARPRRADEGAVTSLFLKVADYMVSDCTAHQLSRLLDEMGDIGQGIRIVTLPGEAKVGEKFMEYWLDEDEAQKIILDLFYEEVSEREAV